MIEAIAWGRPPPPVTRASLDQRNADHAERFARCTSTETLTLLRDNGALLGRAIRDLSDEQLAHTGLVLRQNASVAWLVEHALMGHVRNHLESIRDAL